MAFQILDPQGLGNSIDLTRLDNFPRYKLGQIITFQDKTNVFHPNVVSKFMYVHGMNPVSANIALQIREDDTLNEEFRLEAAEESVQGTNNALIGVTGEAGIPSGGAFSFVQLQGPTILLVTAAAGNILVGNSLELKAQTTAAVKITGTDKNNRASILALADQAATMQSRIPVLLLGNKVLIQT